VPVEKKQDYSQYLRESEYPARDKFYNWLVRTHEKRGKPWTTAGWFSDEFFWSFFLDYVWAWVPSLLFLYVTYYLATFMYDKYGLFRGVAVLVVMALLRVNTLIRKVDYIRRRV